MFHENVVKTKGPLYTIIFRFMKKRMLMNGNGKEKNALSKIISPQFAMLTMDFRIYRIFIQIPKYVLPNITLL